MFGPCLAHERLPSTKEPWPSVTSGTMKRGRHLEGARRRSLSPVRWFGSRERSSLNILGNSLVTVGATVAVATWVARFPWWSVIGGAAIIVAGLIIAASTMGNTKASAADPSSAENGSAPKPALLKAVHDGVASDSSNLSQENGPGDVKPLSVGTDFYSLALPIVEQFESIAVAPTRPRRRATTAVLEWRMEMAAWIRDVEQILDAAYDLAKSREKDGHPSVELAQRTADARTGLQKMRELIGPGQELTNKDFDAAAPQEIWSNVAGVVALAVNS
jgi:hypothetical protein